tara:strand:- start:4077 stop:4952 length:876 start_codon:yes stop_codon:yes gene_type:complete
VKKIHLIIKFFFLKIIYLASIKLNKFYIYDYFSNELIQSNHPKRLDLIKKILENDNLEPNKDKFFLLDELITNKKIIFLGDSHVEFLSRVKFKRHSIYSNHIRSVWLGPRTVIGLNNIENLSYLRKKIDLINKNNLQDLRLVLSIGSIDVRCLYYEILLRKLVSSEAQVYKMFKENFRLFLNEIKKVNIDLKNCYILGLFNSLDKGYEVKNIDELTSIKKKFDFPTFGNIDDRANWTNATNEIIKETLKDVPIGFIPLDEIIKNTSDSETFDNNVHILSKKILEYIYKEII